MEGPGEDRLTAESLAKLASYNNLFALVGVSRLSISDYL